jgi:hypothetical protein
LIRINNLDETPADRKGEHLRCDITTRGAPSRPLVAVLAYARRGDFTRETADPGAARHAGARLYAERLMRCRTCGYCLPAN